MQQPPTIIFFGDRHYDAWPCRQQADVIRALCNLLYIEENYQELVLALKANPRAILALNSIAETPGNYPPATPEFESYIKSHLELGNDLWLLHGGSAAFWPWDWWRNLMPLRWVRSNDPDRIAPSTHPIVPLRLRPACNEPHHVLPSAGINLPADELYINLYSNRPYKTLLVVEHEGVNHPQAYSAETFWGGKIHGFMPGHSSTILSHPDYIRVFSSLLHLWLGSRGPSPK
jgi:hypothetical protein